MLDLGEKWFAGLRCSSIAPTATRGHSLCGQTFFRAWGLYGVLSALVSGGWVLWVGVRHRLMALPGLESELDTEALAGRIPAAGAAAAVVVHQARAARICHWMALLHVDEVGAFQWLGGPPRTGGDRVLLFGNRCTCLGGHQRSALSLRVHWQFLCSNGSNGCGPHPNYGHWRRICPFDSLQAGHGPFACLGDGTV